MSLEKAQSLRLVKIDSIQKAGGPGWKSESTTPVSVRRISTGLNENVADSPSTIGSVSDIYDDIIETGDDATDDCLLQIASKEEGMHKVVHKLNRQEGCIRLEREIYNKYFSLMTQGFFKWTSFVRDSNFVFMTDDKRRWHLHAVCNQSNDLQAWYHGMFHDEVYRLRGPFWYKDALLPLYKDAYDVIGKSAYILLYSILFTHGLRALSDNTLTPAEEDALAHVLCSPDTTYGDVSAHMFVIEAMLNDDSLYQLFLKLTSTGLQITKYPRNGRPARKTFRASFVEGKIYLTWKGKFGNQGVDLGDATDLLPGIHTEILKKSAHSGRANQYLSLICTGRSVDLYFDDDDDRNSTLKLLEVLIRKEKNEITEFEGVSPSPCAELLYWINHKESFGCGSIPVHILRKIEDRKVKVTYENIHKKKRHQ